jgi:hypothetical protein
MDLLPGGRDGCETWSPKRGGVGRPTINPRKDQDPGSLLDSSMLDNRIAIHLRPLRLMAM